MTDQEREAVNKMLAINTGLIEQNAKLLKALEDAREALEILPIDALGTGSRVENGAIVVWPLRDELLDRITKLIKEAGE